MVYLLRRSYPPFLSMRPALMQRINGCDRFSGQLKTSRPRFPWSQTTALNAKRSYPAILCSETVQMLKNDGRDRFIRPPKTPRQRSPGREAPPRTQNGHTRQFFAAGPTARQEMTGATAFPASREPPAPRFPWSQATDLNAKRSCP